MESVEKKTTKRGTGKRGRKTTVGKVVLEFVSSNGNVTFDEILNVYSEEREKLGKKSDDPKIESRNCYSTLNVMVRDGKLKEVEKRKTYTSV